MAHPNSRPISLNADSSMLSYPSSSSPEPVPASASTSVSRTASTTAVSFLAKYTNVSTPHSPTDECPICLDAYTAEPCLRITGIAGCSHHIGGTCLRAMLENRPRDEKRCPLCRTVWIPEAPPGIRSRPPSHEGAVRTDSTVRGPNNMGRDVGSGQRRLVNAPPVAREFAPRGTRPFFAFNPRQAVHQGMLRHYEAQGQGRHQPIVIDSASEAEDEADDYATQVHNFTSLTRDIAEIRRRAGTIPHRMGSTGPRRQTRAAAIPEEDGEEEGPTTINPGGNGRGSRGGSGANGNPANHRHTRSGGNFPGLNTPSGASASVFTRLMLPPARNTLLRTPVNATAPPPAAAAAAATSDGLNGGAARMQHGFALGQEDGVEERRDNTQDAIASFALPDYLRTPSIDGDMVMGGDDAYTPPQRSPPRLANQSDLDARSRFLDHREQALHVRHMELVRREAALREKERSLEENVEAVRREKLSLRGLLRRQRDELDRMLR